MERLQLLKNLMIMATADGRVAEKELEWLRDRQAAWNITAEQFDEALEYAQSGQARLVLPDQPNQRYDFLYDMAAVMSADGHFDALEMNLFAVAAARLQISDEELSAILAEFTDGDELVLGEDP